MKILVLSLLRLGDIIQQAPLLKGLREKYPDAEIHLLLNRQFANVERVLEGIIDKYIFFDRESLQKGLGEVPYNILWSYTQLESLVESLNQEGYDQAINLTHNKLSAYLLGALNIPDKRGLHQEEGRFKGLNNRWIRYFNDRFAGNQKSVFHYVELLGKAFEIPFQPAIPTAVNKKRSKLVLMQCLTSDSKKNWGLEKFRDLKKTIEISLVDYEVLVIGASFERDTLSQVFSESDLLICDLSEAKRHLQNAALLVTGDTSIKHMAAQMGTPIIELSIGSSDATKTAAFADSATVLSSTVPCAPCNHSHACTQNTHLCADDISVEHVFSAVWDQLSGEKRKKTNAYTELDRTAWGLYLDKKNRDVEPFYREAIEDFFVKCNSDHVKAVLPLWIEKTNLFQAWIGRIRTALPARETLASNSSFQSKDVADLILCAQDILKSKHDETGYFQGFVESLLSRFSQPVQIYDKVQAALLDLDEHMNIRENLTRSLQTLSTEGVYYAKGIGHLSIPGFEEAGKSVPRNFENAEL